MTAGIRRITKYRSEKNTADVPRFRLANIENIVMLMLVGVRIYRAKSERNFFIQQNRNSISPGMLQNEFENPLYEADLGKFKAQLR
jgi:hypothetical protein